MTGPESPTPTATLLTGLSAFQAWLLRHMQEAKIGKKEARRMKRGEAGEKAQRRVDHLGRISKAKRKEKARRRRRATRAMKARITQRAA